MTMRRLLTVISEGVPQSPPKQDNFKSSLTRSALKERIINSFRSLEAQAQRVNQLSLELEAEIWELKAIASQVNQDCLLLKGQPHSPSLVISKSPLSLPTVQSNPRDLYRLKSRPVDLFQAEREAGILAQELRKRNKRKHRQR